MDKYDMLYCDTYSCRVNEFERGSLETRYSGKCPSCGAPGKELR